MAAKKQKSPKPRTFKLDIFEILKNADTKNFHYYDSLDTESKKSVQPFVLMRWLSAVSNDSIDVEHYILAVNDIVNVGFFELAAYPDLQWKLLAACGVGVPQRHPWIKGPTKLVTNKFDDLILRLNPSLNDLELSLAKRNFTEDGLTRICRDFAMEDNEIKSIIEEFKKYQASKDQ